MACLPLSEFGSALERLVRGVSENRCWRGLVATDGPSTVLC